MLCFFAGSLMADQVTLKNGDRLNLTRGNSDSLTYSLASKTAGATERDKITVYSDAIYTKSKVNGISSTSAHAIRGGVRGDLRMRENGLCSGLRISSTTLPASRSIIVAFVGAVILVWITRLLKRG